MQIEKILKYPQWKRIAPIAKFKLSPLRSLMYERLQNELLSGIGLDIGGGAKAPYNNILVHITSSPLLNKVTSINISAKTDPTIIGDANLALPLEDCSYDWVLSLNTFEHLEDDAYALKEAWRVLKPGGRILIAVPFMFRVHGAPEDFNRRPVFWWVKSFQQLGGCADLSVESLGWGPCHNFASHNQFLPGIQKLHRSFLIADIILFFLGNLLRTDFRLKWFTTMSSHPLGYFITATKNPNQTG